MFSASFAGGWDEDDLITDSVELASDVDVNKFVVNRLLATTQTAVDSGADVFACQKVNSHSFIFFCHLSLTFLTVSGFLTEGQIEVIVSSDRHRYFESSRYTTVFGKPVAMVMRVTV